MNALWDQPDRYGILSRIFHWGMAILFAAQFAAAAAHWGLPRDNGLRQLLWSYHSDLGVTLFLLVLMRGAWGLANIHRRPSHPGVIGRAAVAGHVAIYGLMLIVPSVRLLAAAGSDRGLTYLGLSVFPARDAEIAWMQGPSEWHGELGWILALLVLGHVAMATLWHHSVKRDGTLTRMANFSAGQRG